MVVSLFRGLEGCALSGKPETTVHYQANHKVSNHRLTEGGPYTTYHALSTFTVEIRVVQCFSISPLFSIVTRLRLQEPKDAGLHALPQRLLRGKFVMTPRRRLLPEPVRESRQQNPSASTTNTRSIFVGFVFVLSVHCWSVQTRSK